MLAEALTVLIALNSAQALTINDARQSLSRSEYDTAIIQLEALRQGDPSREDVVDLMMIALKNRAAQAFYRNDFDAALQDLRRALQIEPSAEAIQRDLATVYVAKASLHLKQSDTAAARRDFLKSREYDPSREDVPRVLAHLDVEEGKALVATGKVQTAISFYRRALEQDEKSVGAHLYLGQLYYNRDELQLAAHHLREARKLTTEKIQGLDDLLSRVNREFETSKGFQTVDIGGFRLRFEGKTERYDLAYEVLPLLQDAQRRASNLLEATPKNALTVIIYSDAGFGRSVDVPDWAVGLFDGKVRFRDRELVGDPARMKRIIRHEIAHAVISEAFPGDIPSWVHEGVARYLELEPWEDLQNAEYLVRAVKRNETLPIEALEKPFVSLPAGTDIPLVYAQSAAFIRYIAKMHGEPAIADLLSYLSAGLSTEKALQRVTFLDPRAFQDRVNNWLLWEYGR